MNQEYDVLFFVEIRTKMTNQVIIRRTPAIDWNDALRKARTMVTQMFPEDPMADRVFHHVGTGIYTFVARNDLGDLVLMRPIAVANADDTFCPSVTEGGLQQFFEACTGGSHDSRPAA